MLKSTEVGHFGAQFGEEGVDQCTPNFNTMLTKMSHQVFCLCFLSAGFYPRDAMLARVTRGLKSQG